MSDGRMGDGGMCDGRVSYAQISEDQVITHRRYMTRASAVQYFGTA